MLQNIAFSLIFSSTICLITALDFFTSDESQSHRTKNEDSFLTTYNSGSENKSEDEIYLHHVPINVETIPLLNQKEGGGIILINIPGVVDYAIGIRPDNHNLALGSTRYRGEIINDDRLFILGENGNVGIGTPDPKEKLEVIGNIKVRNATIRSGPSSPEGIIGGEIGDIYLRIDGGPGSTLYVKEEGSGTKSGWTGK